MKHSAQNPTVMSEAEWRAAFDECVQGRAATYFESPVLPEASPRLTTDRVCQCEWTVVLRAMNEPRVYGSAEAAGDEVYRFLWLRSFDPLMAVRIEYRELRYTLTIKILEGMHGFPPLPLAFSDEREVSKAQGEGLGQLLAKAQFWSSPPRGDRMGLDGASWILEGAQPGRYHVIHRWSPLEDGDDAMFRSACVYLLEMAGGGGVRGHEIY